MTDIANNIIDLLDMEETALPVAPNVETLPAVIEVRETVENDVIFARDNIRNLIQDSTLALKDLILLARQSENPRAYEALSSFMKTFSDLNKDLVTLQKNMENPSAQTTGNTNVQVQNAVFVGSTNDLAAMVKKHQAHISEQS